MGVSSIVEEKNRGFAAAARWFSRSATEAPVYRIILWQLFATVVAASIGACLDRVAAYSILLAGAACVVPSAFMAWRLLRQTAEPGAAVGHMIMAEAGKLTMTVAIFVTIFILVEPISVLLFFGTFVGLQALNILVPVLSNGSYKGAT